MKTRSGREIKEAISKFASEIREEAKTLESVEGRFMEMTPDDVISTTDACSTWLRQVASDMEYEFNQ